MPKTDTISFPALGIELSREEIQAMKTCNEYNRLKELTGMPDRDINGKIIS